MDLMTRLMKSKVYKEERYITHLVDNFRNDRLLISLLNHMIYKNKIKCRTKTTSGKIVAVHTVSLTQRPINDTSAYNAVDAVTSLRLGSQSDHVILSPSITGRYPFDITQSAWPTNLKRLTMSLSRAKTTFTLVGNLLLLNKIPTFSFLIEVANLTNHLHCDEHIRQILRKDR